MAWLLILMAKNEFQSTPLRGAKAPPLSLARTT